MAGSVNTGEDRVYIDNVRVSGTSSFDFEDGLPQGATMSGNANWILSATAHTGTGSMENADIGDSQNATLTTTARLDADGAVSFWRSTSTEGGWDYLRFRIDGAQQGAWSGTTGWAQFTYPLAAGTHTLEWAYQKDGSVSQGVDTVWVDDIRIGESGVCTGLVPTGIARVGISETALAGNGGGGVRYDDDCPDGQVLIGLLGNQAGSNWVAQLEAVCGTLGVIDNGGGSYGVTISPGTTLPRRGLLTGTAFMTSCPADQMVVAVEGRSGALIDQLALYCAPLTLSGIPGLWEVTPGTAQPQPPVGGTGGTAFAPNGCPGGDVARGAVIRAGDSIDAFGLLCTTPKVITM